MTVVRCPVLVGRASEIGLLRRMWRRARSGTGSTLAVVGSAGLGKSRLVREWVDAVRGEALVVQGRAVEGRRTALRPLSEAVFGELRSAGDAVLDELGMFGPVLRRMLFETRSADTSAVLLGEAMVRLLRRLSAGRPVLLVVEDVHWADPDTLAVLEYLADTCAGERLLVVVTFRDGSGDVTGWAERLVRRGSVASVTVGALDDDEVAEMVAACLGRVPDPRLVDVVRSRAEGVPLLVEDLLAVAEPSTPDAVRVPAGFAEATRTVLVALPPTARRCVEAAAVLGEQVDWTILPALVGTDPSTVLEGLRAAVAAGILVAGDDETFAFRHALTRDAVVAALLPPERAATARRALAVLTSGEPAATPDRDALAVRMAEAVGQTSVAARLLLSLGRHHLAVGALATAETDLTRAIALVGEEDHDLAAAAAEVLAETLLQSGQPRRAADATTALLDHLARTDAAPLRAAQAHLRLARVRTITGDWSDAARHIDLARAAGDGVDVVASLVAQGRGRFDEAERLARAALARLGDGGAAEQRCEAWTTLGRVARRTDPVEAERCFTAALRVAERAHAPIWALHALHELSTLDLFSSLRLDRAERAAADAAGAGAVALATTADFHRAAIHTWRGDYDAATALLSGCEGTCRSLRLPLLAMVLIFQAQIAAERGRPEAGRSLCAAATAVAPEDPHVALAADHVAATALLLREDRAAATRVLQRASQHLRKDLDTTSGPPLGSWILLMTLEGDGTVLADVAAFPGRHVARWTRGYIGFARAVDLGRTGHPEEAAAAFRAADRLMAEPVPIRHLRHVARRLVAEAAVRDGWGEPARWLRTDLDYFERAGHDQVAAACRSLLRRAGHPVPRAGRSGVAEPLRALGVTNREAEVLALLGEGLANRDIAARLQISVRTVEKHVERLFVKTGAPSRPALVARAARNAW